MIKIITDSSTLYTREEARRLGFEATPLCVSIGDWHGRDLEMDMGKFYDCIKEGQNPISSQPPIGEVIDAYKQYQGMEIINIAMADGLSGTYQSAEGARRTVANKDDITVVNSKTLCGPHRYIVDEALKMSRSGKSRQEIVDWVTKMSERTESFLLPQDFDFLRRGGRLTPLAAAFGSVLKLKPVMKITRDGKRIDKYAVKRTLTAAVGTIIPYIQKRNPRDNFKLYISHADVHEDACRVKELFLQAFPEMDITILELSPAFVTQGGPGCISIQYLET